MKKGIIAGATCLLAVTACQSQPAICGTSPPDNPALYNQWAKEIEAAQCKNLHLVDETNGKDKSGGNGS